MKPPVVIIGVGEMGGVFARGFLRLGHPVFPVNRRSGDVAGLARQLPDPRLVLIAVGETDLAGTLETLPASWNDRIALLQNELLPADFAHLQEPTVISVWFEKKPGQDARVICPSPVHGPAAKLIGDALGAVGIPTRRLEDSDALAFELVVKNLYILTTNIAGLRTGGTVGELWSAHREFARAVAADVIAIQEAMTGNTFDHDRLLQGMLAAFDGDPDHRCTGRSAPQRLARALEHARHHGLAAPTLTAIADSRTND